MSALTKPKPYDDALIHNLRVLMQKIHLNEASLSRKTNIPQATLHKILAGKTEDPRASTLKTLADFFNISIDELLTGTPPHKETSNTNVNVQSIPIISWEDCIQAKDFISKLTASNWDDWAVTEYLSKHAFALHSKSCLLPRFPKNTILFINPDSTPEDGDLVLVIYKNTSIATLRELSIDGPTQLLLPINPNTETTKLDKDIKILGLLVKSSFSY